MSRIRITSSWARTVITAGLMTLMAACAPAQPPERTESERFTIEAGELTITVNGDPRLFEEYGAEVLDRIGSVDPSVIKPGIGLWVEQAGPANERAPLLLVGKVVAVDRTGGGYLAPVAPTTTPQE